MTAHRYGARCEVCSRCRREWNVSLWAPVGEYLCPVCAEQKRRERTALRDRNHRRHGNRRQGPSDGR